MSITERSAAVPTREWKWTPLEKAVARRAFDRALNRQLDNLVREAKERAGRVTDASQLWELERWLTEQRQNVDRAFDFRYSVLPLVFARLIRDGRLQEHELQGLAEDKLDGIRHFARR